MVGLLYAEHTWAGWLAGSYPTPESRMLDFAYTYWVGVSVIFLVTMYIRRAYDAEREEVQQKAEALKVSNEMQNKLLSILAHDLKEPLSSIQGFLELLVEYKLDDQEREHLEKELLNRTKDTSYLLTNVLSWTKNQMQDVRVTLVPLNLQQTLARTFNVLKNIANDKGIEFYNNIPDDICVTGDRDMLQLIIRNLVMNAIKFTPSGGEVIISTYTEADQCIITVSDTGLGVPLEKQSDLFTISTKSTFGTNREKGAGLGLVLCREFVELQGGEISFSSQENKGSVFYITLSLCPQMDHAPLLL
jgi:signal transduction histidine kinase